MTDLIDIANRVLNSLQDLQLDPFTESDLEESIQIKDLDYLAEDLDLIKVVVAQDIKVYQEILKILGGINND